MSVCSSTKSGIRQNRKMWIQYWHSASKLISITERQRTQFYRFNNGDDVIPLWRFTQNYQIDIIAALLPIFLWFSLKKNPFPTSNFLWQYFIIYSLYIYCYIVDVTGALLLYTVAAWLRHYILCTAQHAPEAKFTESMIVPVMRWRDPRRQRNGGLFIEVVETQQ